MTETAKPQVNHYVLVTGGRDFQGRQSVEEVFTFLKAFYGENLRVIHGAAKGLDSLVGSVCADLGISVRAYPADWRPNGQLDRSAGYKRNAKMVGLLADWTANHGHTGQVIAWPGGKGTADCSRQAESAGLMVDYMPSTTETRTSNP